MTGRDSEQRKRQWLRGWRWAAAAGLSAAVGLSGGGCSTPEFLRDEDETQPVKWVSQEGFITEEVIYRGWDHCYRVSDGAVELIFVPSIGRLMRFSPVAEAHAMTVATPAAPVTAVAPAAAPGDPAAVTPSTPPTETATTPTVEATSTPPAEATTTPTSPTPETAPTAPVPPAPIPAETPTPATPVEAPVAPAENGDDNAPPPMGAMSPAGGIPGGFAVGRWMRAQSGPQPTTGPGGIEPPTPQPTPATSPTASTADSRDSTNLMWVNPKWTGINPPPIKMPFHHRPREYPLYGGVSHWPGPQEKWPTTRAPDLRKLIDVDVNWPPEPGADLVPFTFEGGAAGRVWFKSAGLSESGLRGSIAVEAVAANKGAIDIFFAETNEAETPVEASSWIALPLRTTGYIGVRRDQLAAEPSLWPTGTTFSGPWAMIPLNSRPPRNFQLDLMPAPATTAHVVVLQGECVYALHAQRPAVGEYAVGRTTMTLKKGVLGCPAQVDLVDPENDQHYTIGASSTLQLLKAGEAVELKLRMASKVVHNFNRDQLAEYLAKAVINETIPALPEPQVEGESPLAPNPRLPGPALQPPPLEEYEITPPLPDGNESTSPRVPEHPLPPKPPRDPNRPPPMGPVDS